MFFEKVNYKFFAFPDEDENALVLMLLTILSGRNPFLTFYIKL